MCRPIASICWHRLRLAVVLVATVAGQQFWLDQGKCATTFSYYVEPSTRSNMKMQGGELFQYGDTYANMSDFYLKCQQIGAVDAVTEWQPMDLSFDVDSYLAHVEKVRGATMVQQFGSIVDLNRLKSGLMLCAPIAECILEFEQQRGARHRPVRQWRRLGNLTSTRLDRFLCRTLLSAFLVARFSTPDNNFHRIMLDMPIPSSTECTVAFADIGNAWRRSTEDIVTRKTVDEHPPGSQSVAICIQGGVRSFTRHEVYSSIRDNVVNSLSAAYMRLFFVLNLTSDSCTHCSDIAVRNFTLADISPAIASIVGVQWQILADVAVEPPCCWPQLQDGLDYSDCFYDNIAGPAQSRGKETCLDNIDQYEQTYSVTFDWVLWMRPDLLWKFPIGGITRFISGSVHVPHFVHTDMSDLFALVPRDVMSIYVGAFRDWSSEKHKYFCLTTLDHVKLQRGELCNFRGFEECLHCWYGSIGCVIEKHLLRHNVSLKQIPSEIVERTPRWWLHESS